MYCLILDKGKSNFPDVCKNNSFLLGLNALKDEFSIFI